MIELRALDSLDAQHNLISKLQQNTFPGSICTINLSYNQIEMVERLTFDNLLNLKTVERIKRFKKTENGLTSFRQTTTTPATLFSARSQKGATLRSAEWDTKETTTTRRRRRNGGVLA